MRPLTIITVPHSSLRTVAAAVTPDVLTDDRFLLQLGQTLRRAQKPQGVGLAAPQVDVLWRIFATNLDSARSEEPELRIYINPRLIDRADKQTLGPHPRQPDLEGCLSIPQLYAPVWRPEWVTLEYQTWENGGITEPHRTTFFDFPARVVSHELDHLDGVLFTDHVWNQQQPLYKERRGKLELVPAELVPSLLPPLV